MNLNYCLLVPLSMANGAGVPSGRTWMNRGRIEPLPEPKRPLKPALCLGRAAGARAGPHAADRPGSRNEELPPPPVPRPRLKTTDKAPYL
eukprot:g43907.t1